jgi:tetratricopeptide (TPR) repeat protein
MSPTRLEQLQKFLEEDPSDPFNIYGLALEYTRHEPAKARELFDRLLKEHPEYIPTYYHAAKLYSELNDKDKAIAIYQKGIQVSMRQNDHKTSRELQSAYQELIFE